MSDTTITIGHCVTCNRLFDDDSVQAAPLSSSDVQCQECWEAQCSQSWWEMLDTANKRGLLAE